MIGDCQFCKLSDICKYIYAECCPYNKKKQRMTKEDYDKTRWSPYDSYRMETDQFQVIFISTCNCIPKITKIIKNKVRNGKSLWRSGVYRYVCNGIYYKNKKDFLTRCKEVFEFY